MLLELAKDDRVLLFRSLPRQLAAEVFSYLIPRQQEQFLQELSNEETRRLLADLPPDDRTHLLEKLPAEVTQRLLNLLNPEDLKEARWLLGYPEKSVGRLMTPDYVAVQPEWTVQVAMEHIRQQGRASETIYRVFITNEQGVLLDDIELSRLIVTSPQAPVSEIMDHTVAKILAFTDREEAVAIISKYDQTVLPVVDSDGVLLGIVTIGDLFDVAEAETTEDFHRVSSVGPLKMSLREASLSSLYRARVGWLIALVGMNVFSGAGIAAFEETIQAVVALVFFLPLLIDSGGNAGSQSATLMIRAMATGDVRFSDWFSLLRKEIGVALMIGVTMAPGVCAIAWFRAPEVLTVVALSITLLVVVGSLLGMSLPFIFTRLSWDPATASAPLITSLADITGVLIYFSIATWLLGL